MQKRQKYPLGRFGREDDAAAPADPDDSGKRSTVAPISGASPAPATRPGSVSASSVRQTAGKAKVARRDEDHDETEEETEGSNSFLMLTAMPSWLTSMVVHILILLVMAFWMLDIPDTYDLIATLTKAEDIEELEELVEETQVFEFENTEQTQTNVQTEAQNPETLDSQIELQDNLNAGVDTGSPDLNTEPRHVPTDLLMAKLTSGGKGQGESTGTGRGDRQGTGKGGHGHGSGLGGRGKRRGGALGSGATAGSENAVDLALKWLAEHQYPNGSWNFDHSHGLCRGRCSGAGSHKGATAGATGLGVLTFLGAGQTHRQGKYKNNVAAGLNFLIAAQDGDGNLWQEQGQMYGHGIATLALCEALAMAMVPISPGEMSEDDVPARIHVDPGRLAKAARGAIRYIQAAQHQAGGWRYNPGEAGDTSVVGWQLMALQSGLMARIRVNRGTIAGAVRFLNSCASDEYGSMYSYTPGEPGKDTTTAIGLLCRMYTGWDKTHPGIANGAQYLAGHGPTGGGNLYFDYYATQVMHHYGGALWEQWNPQMRDALVGSQSKNGHETGSWLTGATHGQGAGGRPYCTCLSAMTLEVYYRHSPIYGKTVDEP